MKKRLCFALYAMTFVLSPNLSKGSGTAPFSLTVSEPKDPLKAGAEVRLLVTITNTSDRAIPWVSSPGVPPEDGSRFEIEVEDEKGAPAPPSAYAIQLRDKTTIRESISNIGHTISPGESFVSEVTVTRFFNLSHPGKYTIRLARSLEPWQNLGKGKVKSNAITVTVIPKTQ
jgi:hypothetical protein